jgi:hypothetical protein
MNPYSQEWLALDSSESEQEQEMNKAILALAAAGVLLSGCIAVPYDGGEHRHYRSHDRDDYGERGRAYRDRDGDGVVDRYDRAPRNPYRY